MLWVTTLHYVKKKSTFQWSFPVWELLHLHELTPDNCPFTVCHQHSWVIIIIWCITLIFISRHNVSHETEFRWIWIISGWILGNKSPESIMNFLWLRLCWKGEIDQHETWEQRHWAHDSFRKINDRSLFPHYTFD